MLVLQSLTLYNVKKFKGKNTIDFSDTENKIYSLSGNNGSGKTTVLHSLMIAQMVFFMKQDFLEQNFAHLINSFNCYEKIYKLLTEKDSYIEIHFTSNDQECGFRIFVRDEYGNPIGIEYINNNSLDLIHKYWNLANPSCLFFYLSSDKHFREESVTYDKIKISDKNKNNYILDYILDYENFSENMYQLFLNDYIKERLIPGSPRHDIYFGAAKILFNYLIPYIEISNFTGTKKSEFQLLVKNSKSNNFDVRFLSSGEKTIFYLCLLLSYFTNIGVILIDEPENHLHESLLNKLINLLGEITQADSLLQILIKYSKFEVKDYIKKYYDRYNLQKIIFVTHSKSLIYNNFQFGQNLIIDNNIEELDYENAEKKLREIGLSSIYEKLVIVEGSTEESLFTHILDKSGVHIISANGCDQVLNLYKRIKDLKDYLHSVSIIFMIDKDTKNKEKFNKIRNLDSDFYDEHFIILDKHEIENYFIDRKLLEDVCDYYNLDNEERPLSIDELNAIITTAEDHTKNLVRKKELNEKLHDCIIDYAGKIIQDEIKISDVGSFQEYIKPIFEEINSTYFSDVTKIYNNMETKYQEWDNKKDFLCDGKKAYEEIKSKLCPKLGITPKKFEQTISSKLYSDLHNKTASKYELTRILKDVLNKLDVKI